MYCENCDYETKELCSHNLCSECCEELGFSDQPFDNREYKKPTKV